MTGSATRIIPSAAPEHYQLLALTCVLQNNDTDDELSSVCSNLLAVLGHTVVLDTYVPSFLAALKKASECKLWSARAVVAEFIPVIVFHNFSTIITNDHWVKEVRF